MSGKCRPCLRKKTLENVFHCNLSKTDKECIYAVFDFVDSQKAEIERLKAERMMADGYADALEERAKAEAIKEFAERLKAEMLKSKYNLTVSPYSRACNAVIVFWVEEIDNLVKEMVGEQK